MNFHTLLFQGTVSELYIVNCTIENVKKQYTILLFFYIIMYILQKFCRFFQILTKRSADIRIELHSERREKNEYLDEKNPR